MSATFDLESRATAASSTSSEALPATDPGPAPTPASRPSSALRLRRGFLVAAPVLAGVFLTVGAVADPAAGTSGDAMLQAYFDNAARLQFKSLGFHWAYAFWIVPALLVVPLVRGRGAWLATVTGLLGFAGVATMPGLLMSDWFDSAIGATYGLEGHRAVYEHLDRMWSIPVFIAPGLVALVLGLPLAMATLWRAGLARWWGLAAAVAAFAAFAVSQATWPGTLVATGFLAVVSVALARATRPATQA
jgi:hypothetical protein